MQFQNPTILYFLGLLIIPILIHLFQLQKFEKVPFTNVAFLQKIVQENRKSSRIKKWLILACRLLLFSAILFAFSQPYFSNKEMQKKQHTFIYLDNSLSTNSEGERGNLLKNAAQKIIDNASKEDVYTLQTNNSFDENISYDELKKKLLTTQNTAQKLDFETIFLKISNFEKYKTNTLYKNILISDFQNTYKNKFTNVTDGFSGVFLNSTTKNNLSIDSVSISKSTDGNLLVNIQILNQGNTKENVPIAIYNDEKLLGKQSVSIQKDSKQTVGFTIQNQPKIKGKISITFSDTFSFDNTFYFSLNPIKKTSVLSVGKSSIFLEKIYTEEEFNFNETSLQNLNYTTLLEQQLIILNELENIPEILVNSLLEFLDKGGSLVIIPSSKIQTQSYNSLFGKFSNFQIESKQKDSLKITSINFEHPLFKNVFVNKVSNFQYPSVTEYYKTNTKNLSTIIGFEDNNGFINQINNANKKIFWVASPLSEEFTNFSKSPLIVPVFYNFGKLSFQQSKLYYYLDNNEPIDIEVSLKKDEVLQIAHENSTFIPQQQTYQNKVRFSVGNQPEKAGFYYILKDKDTLQTLAFNNPKEESLLNFLDPKSIDNQNNTIEFTDSIEDVFTQLNKKNEVHWLWKWFLALAIVSLCLEILILKFYKP